MRPIVHTLWPSHYGSVGCDDLICACDAPDHAPNLANWPSCELDRFCVSVACMNALGTRRRCRRLAVVGATAAMLAMGVAGAGTSYAAIGSSYLGVLNQERASHGVAPLHMSADLIRVAYSWAEEMARTGVLRHNPRLESEVPNWWVVGENVGDGPDMQDLEQAFWNSPEHRSNILDSRFTDVGVGAVRKNGVIWIAVVFRKPWHQAAPAVQQPRQQQRAPKASTSQRQWPGQLLMFGTEGPAVAYVQRLLAIRPDGIFGAQTLRAVLAFQRHQHLVVDGIVGPITWSALVRARG